MGIKFKYNCVIDRNTKEIRDKLCNLGYEGYRKVYIYNDNSYKRTGINTFSEGVYEIRNIVNLIYDKEIICCGKNIKFFLAVAAINDSNDYKQWFVHNDLKIPIRCEKNKFRKTALNSKGELIDDTKNYHKMTLIELIEYFY